MSEATSGVLAAARLSRMSLTLMRATAHAEFTFTMSNSPRITIGQYRIENPVAPIRYSPFATRTFSFPRRIAPGVCNLPSSTPEGWRSAETALGCSGTRGVPKRVQDARERAFARHARRLRSALSSPSGGRAPLGAPPWRFWAGARASISGISSGSVQRAPRGQVIVPGGRGPGPPGADDYEPPPRDATPWLRQRDRLRRRPSMSEADATRSIAAIQSQVTYS